MNTDKFLSPPILYSKQKKDKNNSLKYFPIKTNKNKKEEPIDIRDDSEEDSFNSSFSLNAPALSNNNNNLSIKKENTEFQKSMKNLKETFENLMKNNLNNIKSEIFEDKIFRKNMEHNKNFQTLFNVHDIMKNVFVNKLPKKIVVIDCAENKLIDNFLIKVKKHFKKNKLSIKECNNYLFVIGYKMKINKYDSIFKEIIIKKKTKTYKGDFLIHNNENEDECFLMETDDKNETKYASFLDIRYALTYIYQNIAFYSV